MNCPFFAAAAAAALFIPLGVPGIEHAVKGLASDPWPFWVFLDKALSELVDDVLCIMKKSGSVGNFVDDAEMTHGW